MIIRDSPGPAGRNTRVPFGVMVHTTGDGVWRKDRARSPGEEARRIYANQEEGPNYLIDENAEVWCLLKPERVAYHCGLADAERNRYIGGLWAEANSKLYLQWCKRFPGVKNPLQLFPGTRPNVAYVGIEMVPCGTYLPSSAYSSIGWKFEESLGIRFGTSRFSFEQYESLTSLLTMLAKSFIIDFEKVGRLVGHEDINPLRRPGWDPGAYHPYDAFSWPLVRLLLSLVEP